ncbi:MAG: aminopeptidase P N-terminal domain-containing protein [Acidobacteria bacterium]|nr:aminopeptidase P N-terminal domain-containing protein [Acidobacteriota bacterium]
MRRSLPAILAMALVAALAAPASVRAADPASLVTLSPELTRGRRDRLVAELRKELKAGESAVLYLPGAPDPELEEFRQTSDFYYLTGIQTPGAGLILHFSADKASEQLYLPRRNPATEKWSGTPLGPGGIDPATSKSDAERQRTIDLTGFRGSGQGDPGSVGEHETMRSVLSALLQRAAVLLLDYTPPSLDALDTEESKLASEVKERYPSIRVLAAKEAMARLRVVKSPEEIVALRRAASITCDAHRAAMQMVRPGMWEFELEAILEYVFTREGARYASYPAIVGSGPNSCTLHYFRNERRVEDGEVVLIDAGAEYARYATDVTRTFPANGHFSAEQRRVYDAVLKAQDETKAMVRPGVRIRELNENVKKVLDKAGLADRILHGCCHYVGLDVHDVSPDDTILAAGMVLTVEPGAYLPDRGFGVRIEDTLLVTESGSETLSACVPTDADEIEKLMAHRIEFPAVAPEAKR